MNSGMIDRVIDIASGVLVIDPPAIATAHGANRFVDSLISATGNDTTGRNGFADTQNAQTDTLGPLSHTVIDAVTTNLVNTIAVKASNGRIAPGIEADVDTAKTISAASSIDVDSVKAFGSDLLERIGMVEASLKLLSRWPRYRGSWNNRMAMKKFAEGGLETIGKLNKSVDTLMDLFEDPNTVLTGDVLKKSRNTLDELNKQAESTETRLATYFTAIDPVNLPTLIEDSLARTDRADLIAEFALYVGGTADIDPTALGGYMSEMRAAEDALREARDLGVDDDALLELEQSLFISSTEVAAEALMILRRIELEPQSFGATEVDIMISQLELMLGLSPGDSSAPEWASIVEIDAESLSLMTFYTQLYPLEVEDVLSPEAATNFNVREDDDSSSWNIYTAEFDRMNYLSTLSSTVSSFTGWAAGFTLRVTDTLAERDAGLKQISRETVQRVANSQSIEARSTNRT